MAEAFDVRRVNPNPARFDLKKCEALNGVWLRRLPADELARRMVPYLQDAGMLPERPDGAQLALLSAATPLVQERMTVLDEAPGMLGFLFVGRDRFAVEADAAAKVLTADAEPVLRAAHDALAAVPEWSTAEIERALREALVEDLGRKPKHAFGPVRVAVSGRRVSPPLFESLELLGRDVALERLSNALSLVPAAERRP